MEGRRIMVQEKIKLCVEFDFDSFNLVQEFVDDYVYNLNKRKTLNKEQLTSSEEETLQKLLELRQCLLNCYIK